MTTTAPLASATLPDWESAQAHIAVHTHPEAYTLTALTGLLDEQLHHVVLDPDSRTIWWAWDNTALDGAGWTVEQLAPQAAATQLSNYVDVVQDRQDDLYQNAGGADPDADQEALDEYTRILLLDVPADAREAAVRIRRRRQLIARQDALWQRAYANLVRSVAGTEHGGKRKAARPLGVTDVQVGRIIREDDERRAALTRAVRAARRDRN
jgi:hypothetical protein